MNCDLFLLHRTYKYRLYRSDKKDRKLRHKIFVASTIWNRLIALQRRYYRLTKKYISQYAMNTHVLKLRKHKRFRLWQDLHSQACYDVCRRVDEAYQRFFKGLAKHPPKFRKAKKYRSFTFPQSGYKVMRNTVIIERIVYKFVKHRPIGGYIKTLTVKRDAVGRLWVVFNVLEKQRIGEVSTGKSGGFDFGLRDFLTDDEGRVYTSPLFYTQGRKKDQTVEPAIVTQSRRLKAA